MINLKRHRYISRYCHIRDGAISLNGTVLYSGTSEEFSVFAREAYTAIGLNYPKFFKMDSLSKLAFLASEVMLKDNIGASEEERNIAVVFSNKASSLDTDRKHQQTIADKEDYFPSPAVFVYTLPNICIGEISIRYKLYSENSFFIFDHFNAAHLFDYANSLLDLKKAAKVLCGWIDMDKGLYEGFLYEVSATGTINHTIEEINSLYIS